MEHKRKKILSICDASDTLLNFRGQLMAALLIHNDLTVFCPAIKRKEIRDALSDMGVLIEENDLKSSKIALLSDLKYLRSLYRLIKRTHPDLVFPYAFKPVIYGTLVARYCGIKRITPMLTGLGYNFSNANPRRKWWSIITRNLLKIALWPHPSLRVIFQNKDDLKLLMHKKIIRKSASAYVVNGSGVDLQHYRYSVPVQEPMNFLMISRLINAKGVREYYEAAKRMRAIFPEARFKLIGPDEDNVNSIDRALYQEIKSCRIIEYYGAVNDVRPYIRNAGVVVLPSYYGEGVPRSLLEAMAMGRAIITCDTTGCKETVSHGHYPSRAFSNGILIPIRDTNALVTAMTYFMKHTQDIIQFGWNGRALAAEKFDVHQVNTRMLHILQDA
ncbi:glycosyltransferase family 4 protein [Pedobacter gandavensis]|uniref:glycosyltransferase family 4 protein n=1 Tax=Pedobacter gandavensis TaxID=2679963 RepID=UPI002479C16C|nr:glycosyltransferase family 4 protein [Pedobacter gandavensis]WGQ09631.1 glycosyltransferase family 4 protein [Pedobacter gandavensis]